MTEDSSPAAGLAVHRLDEDGPLFAVINGAAPTRDQLASIALRKLGVHILSMPEDVKDLGFLEPLGPALTTLTVTDLQCQDASALSRLTGLRRLDLWIDSRRPVDLSALNLDHFAGRWHKTIDSVFGCSSLERLMLESPPADVMSRVPPAVRRLRLARIKGRRFTIEPLGPRPQLRDLDLAKAGNLELSGVQELSGLRELSLTSISEVHDVALLSACTSLQRLLIDECRSVEGILSGLDGPRLEQVLVIGTAPYKREVDRLIKERGLHWVTGR